MRKSCIECAQKHISQAIILLSEARQGYPEHYFLAIGHLAEASDELVADYTTEANCLRDIRLAITDDRNYSPPLLEFILELDALSNTENTKP